MKADLEYVVLREAGVADAPEYIVAEPLAAGLGEKLKKQFDVVERLPGAALVGRSYLPPFDTYRARRARRATAPLDGRRRATPVAWRVVAADFVTTDSGTGIVHIAPAFGEVDYTVLVAEQARFAAGQGPALINCVAPDGTFTDAFPHGERPVREGVRPRHHPRPARPAACSSTKSSTSTTIPFCWRADNDPLIQYPRQSWFIRTSQFRDEMLANNAADRLAAGAHQGRPVRQLPRDERRLGPVPRAVLGHAAADLGVRARRARPRRCRRTPSLLAKPGVAGTDVFDRAKAANPNLSDDLKVHKPYIDAVTYDSPFAKGARMRRVTEVIDCWFDSGAMPFAQWGWPHAGDAEFEGQFPADFISEAIDQTRGWFYSQLAISTLLFGGRRSPDAPTPIPSRPASSSATCSARTGRR